MLSCLVLRDSHSIMNPSWSCRPGHQVPRLCVSHRQDRTPRMRQTSIAISTPQLRQTPRFWVPSTLHEHLCLHPAPPCCRCRDLDRPLPRCFSCTSVNPYPAHTSTSQKAPGTGLLLLPPLDTGGDNFDAPLAEAPLDVLPVPGRTGWPELEREALGRVPSA